MIHSQQAGLTDTPRFLNWEGGWTRLFGVQKSTFPGHKDRGIFMDKKMSRGEFSCQAEITGL